MPIMSIAVPVDLDKEVDAYKKKLDRDYAIPSSTALLSTEYVRFMSASH